MWTQSHTGKNNLRRVYEQPSAAVTAINIALIVYGGVLTTQENDLNSHSQESLPVLGIARNVLRPPLFFGSPDTRGVAAAKRDARV
jgi:hypothetical protein